MAGATDWGPEGATRAALTLRLVTWNVRGLRTRSRMEEIVPALGRLGADVIFLQETHVASERERSRAQRLWRAGPSIWSYDPEEAGAGVAVLFRSRDDLVIDAVEEAVPGRLLVVDVTLKGWADGREEARPFRLCGLYAPVAAARRRRFWDRLREVCPRARVGDARKGERVVGTGNRRCLVVLGDFNNRSRMADRSAYVGLPEGLPGKEGGRPGPGPTPPPNPPPPPLLPDERELEVFLAEGLGLRDVALDGAGGGGGEEGGPRDGLEFFPVAARRAYEGVYGQYPREVSPQGRDVPFTFYHARFASRLDRVRAPASVRTDRCTVVITPWSDHGMLRVTLGVGEVTPRGPPRLWRLRPEAMERDACRRLIETTLACLLTLWRAGFYGEGEGGGALAWWERVKREVGRRCRRQERAAYDRDMRRYHAAVNRFVQCHARVARGLPCDAAVLQRAREAIACHQRQRGRERRAERTCRTRGPVVAREEWAKAKEGRGVAATMRGLRPSEEDPVSGRPDDMLRVMERYYEALFAEKEDVSSGGAFLEGAGGAAVPRRLSAEEARGLLGPVTQAEVEEAIAGGRSRSAPGPDGLGWAFYKRFCRWLAAPLASVFSECLARDRTSEAFGEGTLIFLPKPAGDRTLPQSWRPIVLTNVDYRLLAKILNARLARVAGGLVVPTQTSAVPGRRMLDSLCAMRELFQSLQGKRRGRGGGEEGEGGTGWCGGRGGMMLLLDQQKAFDKVHHAFLWEVLGRKGVPPEFVRYVRLLYRGAAVVAQLGDGRRGTVKIPVRSGVRQGCPMSPLLYVLYLDTLLSRLERGLEGARFGDEGVERASLGSRHRALKLVAHADDVALLVRDERELAWVRGELEEFEAASGARVNPDKSCVVTFDLRLREDNEAVLRTEPLAQRLRRMRVGGESGLARKRGGGKRKRRAEEEDEEDDEEEEEEEGGAPEGGLKLLGVYFSVRRDGYQKNWRDWADRVSEKVACWKRWRGGLSLYQRAVYVRTYLMPQAGQLAAVYPAPERLVRDVEGTLFQFLWGAKTFPLARAVAYRPVSHGGLAFPAVAAMLLASFLAHNFGRWARREESERLWQRTRGGQRQQQQEREQEEDLALRPFWMEGFRRGWRDLRWAQRWWEEEGRGGNIAVTAADKVRGPDYLTDIYGAVREWKVTARALRPAPAPATVQRAATAEGGDKAEMASLKRGLVWEMLQARLWGPHAEKERRREGRPRYLRELVYPIEAFQDRRVPYRLWETRWRAFHLVLNVQGCKPWLRDQGEGGQACVRLRCRRENVALGRAAQLETVEHAVHACVAARELWGEVAKRLDWPDLLAQPWESVVSGQEPPGGVRGPRKKSAKKAGPRGEPRREPGGGEEEARRRMPPPPPVPPRPLREGGEGRKAGRQGEASQGETGEGVSRDENGRKSGAQQETGEASGPSGAGGGELGRGERDQRDGDEEETGEGPGVSSPGVVGAGAKGVRSSRSDPDYWEVPWPTVRLLNLYVLLALAFQRRWELKRGAECEAARSADIVCRQFNEQCQRDRERLPAQQWRRRWPWRGGHLHSPIT